MTKLLKMNRAAVVLMLAAGMSLECQMAFAWPDAEQEATVISVEQNETPAAADASTQAADVAPAEAGVSDPAVQSDTANAGKDAKKPEQTKQAEQKDTQVAVHILSSNPDDANKHPAWRKRDANKAIGELRKLKGQLMLQGAQ